MSSYFDSKVKMISDYSRDVNGDFGKLRERVETIEEVMGTEVSLVTGDREFPDDLREKIMGLLATQAVYEVVSDLPPTRKALEYLKATHTSVLLDSLHSVFHEVARRRIQTRFGMLSDSPTHILVIREDWEREQYEGKRDGS